MSLQLLQQRGVFVKSHEGLTEAGGQGKDTGPLAFHELIQLLAIKTIKTQKTKTTEKYKCTLPYIIFTIVLWEQTAASWNCKRQE